jgi:replicative DNA helicase
MAKLDLDYFENVLMYNALTDSGYLSTIADNVQPEFFKSKDISDIFTIIKEFNETRNKLPTTTEIKQYLVTDQLKETFRRLVGSFAEIDKGIDKDELIENTEQFLKEKAVYCTMMESAEAISKGEVDTSVILDKFEKSCNISLVTDLGLSVKDNIDDIIEDLTTVEDKIPSSWEWLDDSLDGGFIKDGKSLYVFAGETNIGKSIFLGNVATNIANQGKNVLLITLEMSELLYARRVCTNISKIPMKEMAVNGASLRAAIKEEPGQIFIKEFPPSTVTPGQIQAYIKKFGDQGIQLDAIVIDYLNLIHSAVGTNSYERIKNVTEKCRAMSYLFNCPIISATQLNRAGFDQDNPDLATISESIGLAATADVIMSIFQNDEDRDLGIIRLGMMKNRYGPRGMTQAMRIKYETLTIEQADDVDLEEDDTALQSLAAFSS